MDLKPNAIVRSPLFPEPVKVILTQPVGADLRLIGAGMDTGRTYQPILSAAQLATLQVSPERQPFDGDANRFRLGVEALRLGLAYEYDPYFALSIARFDPLPHQLEAVYHYFIKSPRNDHSLLITATPYKGDPQNFSLFLRLLDEDVYGDESGQMAAEAMSRFGAHKNRH